MIPLGILSEMSIWPQHGLAFLMFEYLLKIYEEKSERPLFSLARASPKMGGDFFVYSQAPPHLRKMLNEASGRTEAQGAVEPCLLLSPP